MKSFLEQYGFAILSAIVVIVLILTISPVGTAVKGALVSTVKQFTDVADNGMKSLNEKVGDFSSVLDDTASVCLNGICLYDLYRDTDEGNSYMWIVGIENGRYDCLWLFYDSEFDCLILEDESPSSEDFGDINLADFFELAQRDYHYRYEGLTGDSIVVGDIVEAVYDVSGASVYHGGTYWYSNINAGSGQWIAWDIDDDYVYFRGWEGYGNCMQRAIPRGQIMGKLKLVGHNDDREGTYC